MPTACCKTTWQLLSWYRTCMGGMAMSQCVPGLHGFLMHFSARSADRWYSQTRNSLPLQLLPVL